MPERFSDVIATRMPRSHQAWVRLIIAPSAGAFALLLVSMFVLRTTGVFSVAPWWWVVLVNCCVAFMIIGVIVALMSALTTPRIEQRITDELERLDRTPPTVSRLMPEGPLGFLRATLHLRPIQNPTSPAPDFEQRELSTRARPPLAMVMLAGSALVVIAIDISTGAITQAQMPVAIAMASILVIGIWWYATSNTTPLFGPTVDPTGINTAIPGTRARFEWSRTRVALLGAESGFCHLLLYDVEDGRTLKLAIHERTLPALFAAIQAARELRARETANTEAAP